MVYLPHRITNAMGAEKMSDSKDLPGIAPDLPQSEAEPSEGDSGHDRALSGRFAGTGKANGRRGKGSREKHGLGALRALVRELMASSRNDEPLPLSELDGRTRAAKALMELRRDMIESQGGEEAVTPQLALLVDLAITDQVVVGSLDAWLRAYLLNGGDITDTDKDGRVAIAPLVRERAYLADSMAKRLAMLGLDRVPAPTKGLSDHLRTRYGKRDRDPSDDGAPPAAAVG